MPAAVKTEKDERLWERAKTQAAKQGQTDNWAYVMKIYQSMKGNTKTASSNMQNKHIARGFCDEMNKLSSLDLKRSAKGGAKWGPLWGTMDIVQDPAPGARGRAKQIGRPTLEIAAGWPAYDIARKYVVPKGEQRLGTAIGRKALGAKALAKWPGIAKAGLVPGFAAGMVGFGVASGLARGVARRTPGLRRLYTDPHYKKQQFRERMQAHMHQQRRMKDQMRVRGY